MPLVFWGPGRVLAGDRRDILVTHLDIAPTILELAAVTESLEHAEGRSLKAHLESRPETVPSVTAVAERRSYEGDQSQMWAMQDDRYSFVSTTELDDELFDVNVDPYQTQNLAKVVPDVVRRYRAQLDRIVTRLATSSQDSGLVDEETLSKLRSLGYIQ